MNPSERRIEFLHHLAERSRQRSPTTNQHIIVARTQQTAAGGRRQSNNLPQPAAHTVTLHGVAYLSRYGEPNADRSTLGAPSRLQDKSAPGGTFTARHCPKIAAARQALDDGGTDVPLTH